jgi:hypothetical protein
VEVIEGFKCVPWVCLGCVLGRDKKCLEGVKGSSRSPKNLRGSGGVKKGGAGGKFTWGNMLDEEGMSTLDR